MRFERLELCNWDIQANQLIVLQSGVNLLTGENGSGKTSILDAIKVALGATRIGADRSVDEYLRKRAAPFAMLRLVVDNRSVDSSRERPLSHLGNFNADQVTMAVTFEADDDGYQPRYYLLDGDHSPLHPGFSQKPFTRKRDYLDRLDKLGMGPSFRRLLCTPQGQIASLCQQSPARLFDLLFGFIGGKEGLEEWLSLRSEFEKQRRERQDRGQVLDKRETELEHLQMRLKVHRQFRQHIMRRDLARRALPYAYVGAIKGQMENLEHQIQQAKAQRDEAAGRVAQARVDIRALHEGRERMAERANANRAERGGKRAVETELRDQQTKLLAEYNNLEELRVSAAALPARELSRLQEQRTALDAESADMRHQISLLDQHIARLDNERRRLAQGVLTPPEGVDEFRAVLKRADVPHHLLLDLLDPQDADAVLRHALESYLGDLRFAVAVPDSTAFRRAVALAREHRFPFYILSPDVRSPAPQTGEHPFLEATRVSDPRYQGLIRRVLRNVRWLEGEVTDTHRGSGALVDPQGYVLDRKGGSYRGTERYYLGREALVRRQQQIASKLDELRAQRATRTEELQHLEVRLVEVERAIDEEQRRQKWLASAERHAYLQELRESLQARVDAVLEAIEALEAERDEFEVKQRGLERELGKLESELENQERLRDDSERQRKRANEERTDTLCEFADAQGQLPDAEDEEALAYADQHDQTYIERFLKNESELLQAFDERDKDPNLPANVDALERQVKGVRQELARLDEQVDLAREAVERAYEQYKNMTRRVFRRYFARLRESAQPLGFTTEGRLRSRDDGQFEVELKVAVREKSPVLYNSSSLSGGQKAALSILMSMTTLELDGRSAGFFLVDEPFSASDSDKIQELGAFLHRTGAQYLVSMPTTTEIKRCGSWLQAVLTCTQTEGGVDEKGNLRIAPRVKCSYVPGDDEVKTDHGE